MENYSSPTLSVYISSDVNTSGIVEMPLIGWVQNFTVTANTTSQVIVPTAFAQVTSTEVVENKGIHVIANDSISVYALNYEAYTSDAAMILPVQTLGIEYYVMAINPDVLNGTLPSEFLIIGAEDNTQLEIIPSVATDGGNPAGVPFSITLNQGEAYQVQADGGDLTGSLIKAVGPCKKFAVFSGVVCTDVGGCHYCDHLYEQMYPVTTWGKAYITTPFLTRNGEIFRIMAAQNNTSVTINGGSPFVLNAGQFNQAFLSTASYIEADKPIMVSQYSRGQDCDGANADPFMIMLSPVEQTLDIITFNAFTSTVITSYYLNVVSQTNSVNLVILDGNPIAGYFNVVPANPLYSYARLSITQGNHTLSSDSGIVAYVYGYGSYESYGYVTGAKLKNLWGSFYVTAKNDTFDFDAIPNAPLCPGTIIGFNAIGDTSVISWDWDFGDTITGTGQNVSHTYADTGSYTVTLTILKNYICTIDTIIISQTINIGYNPPFTTIFPSPVAICPGDSALLTVTGPAGSNFLWSTGEIITSILVSPPNDTIFTVTTDYYGCINEDTAQVIVTTPQSGPVCNVLYVTTTGSGTGTIADPADLLTALSMTQCNGTVIKMAIGVYNFSAPITSISSFTIIEGGFDPSNNWEKTSSAGATTIFRDAANLEGPPEARRLGAIYMNGVHDFRLQDLTISTADAPAADSMGISIYGIHLTNCYNYDIVRCQILPGDASNGIDGLDGVDGANGSPGGNGAGGDDDDQCSGGYGGNGGSGGGVGAGSGGSGAADDPGCYWDIFGGQGYSGLPGSSGIAPLNPRAGGGGGGGGSGGQEGNNGGSGGIGGIWSGPGSCGGTGGTGNGCDPNNNATSGCNGNNGADGANGAFGPFGAHIGGFWVPGGKGGDGAEGMGGAGGGGGGGGAGEGGGGCIDGAGSGGGGGGGGAEGGAKGTGGYGGGASYAIYLYNNGSGGNVINGFISSGINGAGGTGGSGGNGGTGSAAGIGDNCCGQVGDGANGGTGGDGGNGGDGGSSQPGESYAIYFDGGSPLTIADTNFNLPAQPVIFADNVTCTNNSMDLSTSAINNWDFGAGANPPTDFGTNVTTQYSTIGFKDITYGTDQYTGFVNIILDDSALIPQIATNAQLINGEYTLCLGDTAGFQSLVQGINYIYYWDLNGATSPDTYTGTNYDTLNGLQFNTAGIFTITLQIQTPCCGLSAAADTLILYVDSIPNVQISSSFSLDICLGDTIDLIANGGVSYMWSTGDTTDAIVVNPADTTIYYVAAFSQYGCIGSDSAIVNVIIPYVYITGQDKICYGDSATLTANGPPGATYQWGGDTVAASQTIIVNPTDTSIYFVTATLNGCVSDTDSIEITVISMYSSIVGDTVICKGDTAILTCIGGDYFIWSTDPGDTTTSPSISVTPDSDTGYWVIPIWDTVATINCNILEPDTINVTVISLPSVIAAISGLDTVCIGNATTLTASGAATYLWSPASGLSSTTGDTVIAYPVATTTYTVTGTNSFGCYDIDTITITVIDSITVNASFTVSDSTGDIPLEVFFENNSSGSNSMTYLWDFGDPASGNDNITDIINPSHTYSDSGLFQVMLVAYGFGTLPGCTDTAYQNIRAISFDSLFIPNVFSPNDDGVNDIFNVIGSKVIQVEGIIFNRWGEQIYTWNTIKGGWDGRTNSGKIVPDGTYFYIITVTTIDGEEEGELEKEKLLPSGTITLIR
ncbi:MAG: gliding motility-associated C-terminal domain-containing protein [Bacteroidota bacterium]